MFWLIQREYYNNICKGSLKKLNFLFLAIYVYIIPISYSFLPLIWIGSGGKLTYPNKGSITAFYSLSGEKTG